MKEFSFLMFLIAFAAILSAFFTRVFRLNPSKQVYFYIPDSQRFNITWGFIFYIAYGLIIAKTAWLRWGFAALIAVMMLYLIYLYTLKSFFAGHHSPISPLMIKIVNFKLNAQKRLDKDIGETKYSQEKALKIMGLAPFALRRPEMLNKRLQMLKNLQSSKTLKNPYLPEIIEKLASALDIK